VTPVEKPGVVFDCMVFFQATARRTGPAAACFTLLEGGAFTLLVSEPILAEVADVLSRPTVRRKNPRLNDETVRALFERLSRDALLVKDVPEHFTYPRDPDDEPYINLAIAAGASYLVSRDKDLLDLRSDADFRSRFPHLTILDPVEFVRLMSPSAEPEATPQEGAGTE
jgi:putative PIN family toxin of toxin-antitoxin system